MWHLPSVSKVQGCSFDFPALNELLVLGQSPIVTVEQYPTSKPLDRAIFSHSLHLYIHLILFYCRTVILLFNTGAPYPQSLAIQCAALARCVAHFIDNPDPAQRSVLVDEIYDQTALIDLIRFHNDVHSRVCGDKWFSPPLWAAFVQLRVTLWFVKSRRHPEVVAVVIQRSFFKIIHHIRFTFVSVQSGVSIMQSLTFQIWCQQYTSIQMYSPESWGYYRSWMHNFCPKQWQEQYRLKQFWMMVAPILTAWNMPCPYSSPPA